MNCIEGERIRGLYHIYVTLHNRPYVLFNIHKQFSPQIPAVITEYLDDPGKRVHTCASLGHPKGHVQFETSLKVPTIMVNIEKRWKHTV